MVISFGRGVNFVVVLHQVWKKHPVHQDFLGFYVLDSHRMSTQTHGLLGKECSDSRLLRLHKSMGKATRHPVPRSRYPSFASTLKGQKSHYLWQWPAAKSLNAFVSRSVLPPL